MPFLPELHSQESVHRYCWHQLVQLGISFGRTFLVRASFISLSLAARFHSSTTARLRAVGRGEAMCAPLAAFPHDNRENDYCRRMHGRPPHRGCAGLYRPRARRFPRGAGLCEKARRAMPVTPKNTTDCPSIKTRQAALMAIIAAYTFAISFIYRMTFYI